jgi:uncharacterized protein
VTELPAAVAETHSGVVVLLGDRAYKLKKPVDLGFLDFRTREAREAICHREVELNRRLAPDVYLGVADVLDPSGALADHLIVMRRLPDDRRLSTLVSQGASVSGALGDLAVLLADFHDGAERSKEVAAAAGADAMARRWSANTAALARFGGRHVDTEVVDRVEDLAQRYVAGRRALFDRRIVEGRACDGHGDLLADDIFCLDDGPRVLDCIEFDDALRHGDALADVAFLAMDLERLGRPDLGSAFLADYRAASGDSWPPSLEHHHVAHRAQIRAKVAAIRADQGHRPSGPEARRLLDLALGHLVAGRVRLILVGGLPGTGKSTLSKGIGSALGAPVLRSDVLRKERAGIPGDQPMAAPFRHGLYADEVTAATYGELLDRARGALGVGESVVLDASWTDAAWRRGARELAEETSSDVVELRCEVPPDVAAARMERRRERGGDPSDGDAAVASAMAARADPWPEAATVDTSAAPADALSAALSVLSG